MVGKMIPRIATRIQRIHLTRQRVASNRRVASTSIGRLFQRCLFVATLIVAGLTAIPRSVERSTAATLAADPHTLLVGRDLSDAKTLDPDRLLEVTDESVDCNVYDTLVTVRGTDVTHIRPDLATRWTISSDARTFTFSLRHNVRFSNGDRMTAADVVFSYRRLGFLNDNPSFLMGATTVGSRLVINQVRAVGKFTVRFTLPAPDVSFLAALADVNFGVLDARVVRAHGGDDSPQAFTKDTATTWLNEHSAGTGPFVLASWVRGSTGRIVLKRNPHYWGSRPFLNQIVFEGIPDTTTQRLEVSRGTIDVAANIDIDGARTLSRDPYVRVVTGNTLDFIYLAMTTKPTISQPLSSIKVRRAIRAALDYTGIIKGLLGGTGTQLNSAIPVGMLGNDRAVNNSLKPRTNLALARRLLKQAGYPNGFSITMNYPDGTTVDGVSYDLLAPKVAHDLGAIGIKVTLAPTQLSVLLPAYRAGTVALTLWFFGFDFPDPHAYASLFSPGGFVAKHVWYTWDANLTKLVARADSTSKSKQRIALYRQIQQVWLREGPWGAIVQPRGIVVLHRGVTNYHFSPLFQNDFRFVRKR